MQGSQTEYVKQLYDASASLTSTKNTINANKNSAAIDKINTQYKQAQSDGSIFVLESLLDPTFTKMSYFFTSTTWLT